jgi:glycosyltransferase involved in cell wall biosynthesis
MKKKKMLAVGMLPPPMGGQALMFKRAVHALRENYDLEVIDIQFQKNLGESGVFSSRKVLHFFTLLFGKIIPSVHRRGFDILYYCLSGPSTLGLIKDLVFLSVLRPRAKKTVYHIHGAGGITFLLQQNVLLRAWARLVLFKPDLVLRPASSLDESALCKAGAGIVVDNCAEDPLTSAAKPMPKWPDVELSFAFVGLVTEDKGVFDLVEIARLLRDKGHQFTMSIVGEGLPNEVARLEGLIRLYDLTKSVRLTGVLVGEEKFRLLRQTTVFLFPTFFRAETQPTALMEALAVGVPIVAYDWRGINTIIDQGVNGYMVPSRDVNAFCGAIDKILANEHIDAMRAAARRIFEERFTPERHVEALRRAFESLM